MTKPEPRRIPDALIEEIRQRLPIQDVVSRSVRLTRTGAWWKGICPFHGERNPSFAVHPARRNFHCFGCGAHGDVIRFVMKSECLSFPDAARRCAAEAGMAGAIEGAIGAAPWAPRTSPAAAPPPRPEVAKPMDRIAAAWRIWQNAAPIAPDGLVASYLRGRGLTGIDALHPVLRGAALRHPDTADTRHPCMIARVDGPDGKFAGIHRTYLAPRPDGSVGKLPGVNAKLTLGQLGGGAVRLHEVAPCLGLAEGIETAIAAWNLSGIPVWPCISAGGLESVGLPFDVEEVIVFADRDGPTKHAPEGRGLQAARKLEARLRADAVRCVLRMPIAPHGDYADVAAAMLAGECAA